MDARLNQLAKIDDFEKAIILAQYAHENGFRGGTALELYQFVKSKLDLTGLSNTAGLPEEFPQPETTLQASNAGEWTVLGPGVYNKIGAGTIELSDDEFAFAQFDGTDFNRVLRVKVPQQEGVDDLDPEGEDLPKEKAVANYVVQEKKYFDNVGYVDKYFGNRNDSSTGVNYRSSNFLKIQDRESIVVTGVSGSESNNVALIGFYDRELNYIGFYNDPETAGNVDNHLVPADEVPERAEYIKATRLPSQDVGISGVQLDGTIVNIPEEGLYNNWFFKETGHIHKFTGDRDISSGSTYRSSKFLKLIDRGNLVVTGFSGANNTVALLAFYDLAFNFLGAFNDESHGGVVEEMLIPESSIPADTEFIKVTKLASQRSQITGIDFKYRVTPDDSISLIDKSLLGSVREQTEQGYINKNTGYPVYSTGYRFSALYEIHNRSNLQVSVGFSGVNNNVALISFFDNNHRFIGYYNPPTIGAVTDVIIPEENIPELAAYCKFSIINSQGDRFKVIGARKIVVKDTKTVDLISQESALSKFNLSLDNSFNNLGYINKTNGFPWDTHIPTTGYRNSAFLRIADRQNLSVTGYSGVSNNAALAYFYNESFEALGFYNADTNGYVTEHQIHEENIPTDAYYVRFTRNINQPLYITGVSLNYELPTLLRYIDGKKTEIPKDVTSERSGRPNPDFGGHLKLINYLGNDQNIHPKVLYFETAWNGYQYWMAYTPYPNGSVLHENPCMAASTDGENWVTPEGLINPLEFTPRDEDRPTAYNSDTHLVYNDDTNELECWWRSVDPGASPTQIAIKRRRSTDGINWLPTEYMYDWGPNNQVSQAIIYEDGLYKYWACSGAATGKVIYTESADPFNFPPFTTLPINLTGLMAWHLDVARTPKGLEFAIQAWVSGIGNNNSSDLYHVLYDGANYSEPKLIVERGDRPTDRDYMGIYRASIVYIPYNNQNPKRGGVYSIYYSALANNFSFRAIYLTKGRGVDRLRGVNL